MDYNEFPPDREEKKRFYGAFHRQPFMSVELLYIGNWLQTGNQMAPAERFIHRSSIYADGGINLDGM
jgi:hypothetical protein